MRSVCSFAVFHAMYSCHRHLLIFFPAIIQFEKILEQSTFLKDIHLSSLQLLVSLQKKMREAQNCRISTAPKKYSKPISILPASSFFEIVRYYISRPVSAGERCRCVSLTQSAFVGLVGLVLIYRPRSVLSISPFWLLRIVHFLFFFYEFIEDVSRLSLSDFDVSKFLRLIMLSRILFWRKGLTWWIKNGLCFKMK